jgi:lysophospholipase L1-like esterase
MKTITFKIIIFLLLCFSFYAKSATIASPTITINPSAIILNQPNTWTFDFAGSALTGTENLVIYFWQPTTHASVSLSNLGNKKWSLTFTPTTFFGLSMAQIAANKDQFYFNIQDGVGGVTGTLHTTFSTPVTTMAPISVTNNPVGNFALDQPVTWTFDLTGSGFTAGMDLYMWAWSPSNPDAPNYSNSSAFTKLTYVSGMTWTKTITPTIYFGKTVAEIQAASGFWMKLKDLTGKIETLTFTTVNVDATSITISGSDITTPATSIQLNIIYTPTTATQKVITWSVDDATIASISNTGLLTPLKNGKVNITASFTQNGQTISTTKEITISNQLSEFYVSGTATKNGDNQSTALSMNQAMGVSGIIPGVFELSTTINATGTLKFYASKTDNTLTYGAGLAAGTIAANGVGIDPSESGQVLIRVYLATNTYKIFPIDSMKISMMGSSVAFGYGATSNRGYAYQYNQLLQQRYANNTGLNWSLSNISIGGNTTVDLLNRWDSDLLNNGGKYVIYALSLANEGVLSTGQVAFDQFKKNMLLLIEKAKSVGKIPIIAGNYSNYYYNSTHYAFVNQMNMLINDWDVPSINLLGNIDDGTGKWPTTPVNYQFDSAHPNDAGHAEMSLAIVPSLFDALQAKKPQPQKQNGTYISMGKSITTDKLSFTPENMVHSFTLVVDVKTSSNGTITSFKQGSTNGNVRIEATTGCITYISPNGGTINGVVVINDGQWHKITLTHYYAWGQTILYTDNTEAGRISEKLSATDFFLNDSNAPATIDYRNWMFYRAGMNVGEIAALNADKMLKSSLELYAPLDGQKVNSNDTLINLAQSTNKIQRIKISTKIKKLSQNCSIKLFPNPVRNELNVLGLEQNKHYDYSVYSLDGKKTLKSIRLTKNTVDVSGLPSSHYIIILNDKLSSEQIALHFQKIDLNR